MLDAAARNWFIGGGSWFKRAIRPPHEKQNRPPLIQPAGYHHLAPLFRPIFPLEPPIPRPLPMSLAPPLALSGSQPSPFTSTVRCSNLGGCF